MRKGFCSVSFVSRIVVVASFATALVGVPTAGMAAPILLPDLASFAVLGEASVTNVGPSTIFGNVGVGTGVSITGFGSLTPGVPSADTTGQVTGGTPSAFPMHQTTALANQAALDLDAVIVALNAFGVGTTVLGGDLDAYQTANGGFIGPGTYTVPAATTNLVGTLNLDGGLDLNPVWVFQFPTTLITADLTANVVVTGSYLNNAGIYWNVGTAATLNGPTFAGNVVARTLISSNGNLTMSCGRLLVSGDPTAAPGAVTLIGDTISVGCLGAGEGSDGYNEGGDFNLGPGPGPGPSPVPEPTSMLLLASGLAGIARRVRRRIGSVQA